MKSDRRSEEEEEAPAEGGAASGALRFLVAGELRLIDAAIGFFQRLRNRIAPPLEDEEPRRGARRGASHDADGAAADRAPPKSRRMRNALLIVAALLASGIAGMDFSYRILARIIDSNDMVIDDLRDEIAKFQKQEVRNLNAAAKYRQQIEDGEAALAGQREEIADYRNQIADLRVQLSALTGAAKATAAGRAYAAPVQRPTRRAPDKTGSCVTGTQNAAANLARCVEQFNR